jgi:phosphoribosyl-ATP pyrophosphohydrolase
MGKGAKRERRNGEAEAAVKPGKRNKLHELMPPPRPTEMGAGRETSSIVLERLWGVVMSRRDADPAASHSARLLSRGIAKVAQKFGEEAVECLIEAVAGNRAALIGESADVLYHLIVLWVASGLRPEEVWAELVRREGISGITEKAARGATNGLGKIP